MTGTSRFTRGLAAAVLAGATLLAACGTAVAAPYRGFIVSPERPGAVSRPSGVAMDGLGITYVADTGNDRIAVYGADGTFLRSLGEPGNGSASLSSPVAVALGPSGVYVADAGNDRVAVLTTTGSFVREMSLPDPIGVAVGTDGTVYATALGLDAVRVFKTNATQATWGSTGVTNGLFIGPQGLAVNGTFLYVTDTGNQRVQVLNSSTGGYVNQWGPVQTADGTFVSRYVAPVGLTVAPGGNLVVTDSNMHFVQRVAQSGFTTVTAWGTSGTGGSADGYFNGPRSASISASGTLVVADTGNNRLARYASGWQPAISANTTSTGGFWSPRALTVDASGTVLVADSGNDRIPVVGANGSWQGVFGAAVDDPRGLAITANGDRLVSDAGADVIRRFSSTGAPLGSFGAGQLLNPAGIAIDGAGNIWVADAGNHRLVRFRSDGTSATAFGSLGAGDDSFNQPTDVAFDPFDDSLWVADSGNHRVKKIAVSGGTFRLKVPDAPGSGSGTGHFLSPQGIAIDPAGGVFVADTGNDRVQRFDRAGNFIESFGARGILPDRLHAPVDIAVGPAQRLWVLEREGARLQAFTTDTEAPLVTVLGLPAGPVDTDVDITLSATDTGVGVDTVWWRVDGGLPQRYEGAVRISTEGTTTFGWWAEDLAGNVSTEQTATIVIDRTAPTGSFLLGDGGYWNPGSPAEISSAVDDAVLMRFGIGTEFGAWASYEPSATIELPASDGRYTLTAEYQDEFGRVLRLAQPFGLDRSGPAAPAISSPTHPQSTVATELGQAVFAWEEPADLSGVDSYSWVFDREPTTTPPAVPATALRETSVEVDAPGEWYFHVRARDAVGNWGAAAHYRIVVVETPRITAPRPVRSAITATGERWKYSGSLLPVHDGCLIEVNAYRLSDNGWTLEETGTAFIGPAAGGRRYRGSLDLSPGTWRLIAVHAGHGAYGAATSPDSAPFVVR